jgi:hypothetical protein
MKTEDAIRKIVELGFRRDQFTAIAAEGGAVRIFFNVASSLDAESRAKEIARAGFFVRVEYHAQWGGEFEDRPSVLAVGMERDTPGAVLLYWERSAIAAAFEKKAGGPQ